MDHKKSTRMNMPALCVRDHLCPKVDRQSQQSFKTHSDNASVRRRAYTTEEMTFDKEFEYYERKGKNYGFMSTFHPWSNWMNSS